MSDINKASYDMEEDISMSDYTCSEDEGTSGRRLGAAGAACTEDAARQNKEGDHNIPQRVGRHAGLEVRLLRPGGDPDRRWLRGHRHQEPFYYLRMLRTTCCTMTRSPPGPHSTRKLPSTGGEDFGPTTR
ncbi:hypothetical protein RR46_01896 [Papilio xuthus]|uniref:Uncharacterized protein n=1 Tax=Papilio xuthus TaxID=66420 RepID=A0A194QLV8_PAPXU|nr:hypothetical protein RR46_01896 [Papilio xuthus]